MTLPFGLYEEDYLDWLENALRSPADLAIVDGLFLTACLGITSTLIAGLWLVRR